MTVSVKIPDRVDDMTELERDVVRLGYAWASLQCDCSNDKPWSQLRDEHREWMEDCLNRLSSYRDYALDDDEYDKLFADQ